MSNITVTRNQNNSSMSVNNQTTEVAVNRTESLGVTLPWMEKEDKSNKVQTIGPSSTAYQYPSAKAVYEAIEAIPTLEQKQSDWTQTDASEVDYIKNKPSLATVATSGSYNDLSDKPEIPVVPTDLSSFNNDVGYITLSQVPEQVQSDWNQTDSSEVDYIKNKPSIPVVPTNVSAFTNDAGYITINDVPEQVNSDWNSNSGKSQILNKPNLATVATSGSYTDLSDKPVIPAAQVQSDWTQSDSSAPDYIKNKPSMPSAQIQSDWAQTNIAEVDYIKNKPNLSTVATSGSYNDLSDKPVIPTVPTDLSAFNNDVGYITLTDVPQQQQSDWNQSDNTAVDYIKNKPTIPVVPTNVSSFTNDAGYITINDVPPQEQSDWAESDSTKVDYIKNKPTLSTVATSGSYNDLSDKPTIPAAQINSDWDAVSGVAQILNKPSLATVATSGDYDDLSNKPTIPVVPTNVSSFTNDVPYATTSQIPNVPIESISVNGTTQTITNKNVDISVPTETSDLTNDSGFITINDVPAQEQSDWSQSDSSAVDYIKNKPSLATVATSGNYNDLSNKPTIPVVPTNVSAFTNDVPYATTSQIPVVRIYSISVNGVDQPVAQGNVDIAVPDAQIQSDWSQSDSTAVDYIKNKPSLATVATSGSYTDLSNTPTIPTNVSDLNNDSGFITSWGQADWNQTDNSEPDYIKNKPTIPAAQVNSDWNASSGVAEILNKPTLATVATTGDYGDLLNTPTIPAAQVNSDWDAVSGVAQILNKPSLATVATSGSYTDLSNTPTIPTKVSDLQNDSGFITSWGQADWNQSDNTASDYIKNKPSIPASPVQSDWNESDSSSLAYILNKPTIPSAQVNSDWNASSGVAEILNKPNLATVATSGSYNDLSNTPTIPTKVSDLQNDSGFITSWGQADWSQSDNTASDYVKNKPSLATVATSGSYNDLSDKPSIPAAQVNADWNSSSGVSEILNKPSLATVATSGSYNDLLNTPTIPAAQVNSDWTASSGVAEILHKPTIPVQAQSISSGDTGYTTGDQVYQAIGDIESLLLALRGNI